MKVFVRAVVFMLYSVIASQLVAQAGTSVSGMLVDTSGAAVAAVPIALQDAKTDQIYHQIADSAGAFRFENIPPGKYRLFTESYAGFAPTSQWINVPLRGGNLTIRLHVESVNQDVVVQADNTLSTDSSENKSSIGLSRQDMDTLPVFDQDFVAMLTPFLDPASVSTSGPTLVVDGVEMKGVGVSSSAIQEVRINNDPYSAESNRPGRGRIEVMTKPGSSQMHGSASFTFRDSALNAKNYFAVQNPEEQRRIFEGYLTGPAAMDGHTTFVLTASRQEEDLSAPVYAYGLSGPITDNVATPTRMTTSTFRIAHDFSEAHRTSLQYNFSQTHSQNQGVGGIVLAEAGTDVSGREDDLFLNDRIILSPTLVNQLQIVLEKDADSVASAVNEPAILVSDSFTGGGAQADLHKSENTIKVNEIVSWSHGRHYLRFGANVPNFGRRAFDDSSNRLGIFRFASLDAYRSQTPYSYFVQQGTGRAIFWYNEIGGFLQDQITVTKQLQLSLGLRYDWQTYLDDYNNFAPRVSAAWSPQKSGKTIVRTGTGIFYDRTSGDPLSNIKLHNGIVLCQYQILNPVYPTPLPNGTELDTLPVSFVRFADSTHTPYTVMYSAEVERQLTSSLTLVAGYRGGTGVGLFRSRDANAPEPPALIVRPDAHYGRIQQIESEGRQRLNAFDLSLKGKIGGWFNGQVQYSLSRIENNTSGIAFFPQNQYDPDAEWGRADADRLHRFNLLGTLRSGHWLSLGVNAALYSASPYTETAGGDLYNTGLGNARPAGVGRNTLSGAGVTDLDLRWSHDIPLGASSGKDGKGVSIMVDAFNILNTTNDSSYIGNIQSPLFRHPTASLPARQLQMGVKYHF